MKCKYLFFKDSRGSATVMLAILMFAFVGLLALVIDLAHLQNVKTELSNAADDCALAGARGLFLNPPGPVWSGGQAAATSAIGDNKADNATLLSGQIQTGYWDLTWDPQTPPPNLKSTGISPGPNDNPAVKVTIKKTAGVNNDAVKMTLAQIFGIKTVDVSAQAVAICGYPSSVGPGNLFPVVISKTMADTYWDKPSFIFRIGSDYHYPLNQAGQWTSFNLDTNDVPTVSYLMANGNPTPLSVGDSIWIEPGTKTTLYNDAAKYIGKVVFLPVVNDNDFTTHAEAPIVGFLPFLLMASVGGSGKYLEGHFAPGYLLNGSSPGGPDYGAVTPPKLVQ